MEEVKTLISHQLKAQKHPPPPIMSEAEANALAAREGLTLVKGATNSGYTLNPSPSPSPSPSPNPNP